MYILCKIVNVKHTLTLHFPNYFFEEGITAPRN